MFNRSAAKQILVLGAGPQAQSVVQRLAALPGVASVRQQSHYVAGQILPKADLCLEMLEGLSTAYEATLQALAQGMGVVIGSPILAATHGHMLRQAAQGQGAFCAFAAHGVGVLPAWLHAMQASQVVWVPHSVAQAQVVRLSTRHEAPAVAAQQLSLAGADPTELSGKRLHLMAHTLLGAWQNIWPEPTRQPCLRADELDPAMLGVCNALGLRLAYGVVMNASGVRTGPLGLPYMLAVPEAEEQVLWATTPHGSLRVAMPLAGALETTMLGAVQAYLSGQRGGLGRAMPTAVAAGLPRHALVLGPRAPAGAGPWLAQHTAQGWWGGVVNAAGPQLWPPEYLVLPVPLPYQPLLPHGLRLVG
jgi:hypothetical protein